MPIESAYHGALCEEVLFLAATRWIRRHPSLRWRFRPAVIIAMCDEVAEQHVPRFPAKPVFCQWNFPDPLATKAGDAEQEGAIEQVCREILRRVSVLVAFPLHSRKAAARLLRERDSANSIRVDCHRMNVGFFAARRQRAARGVSMH